MVIFVVLKSGLQAELNDTISSPKGSGELKTETLVLVISVKIYNAARDTILLYLDTATRNIANQRFANAVIR